MSFVSGLQQRPSLTLPMSAYIDVANTVLRSFSDKWAATNSTDRWRNTHTMWYQRCYTIGWQSSLEARTNRQNSDTEINISLDPTNTLKWLINNHSNVFQKKRSIYSAPFCKLCECITLLVRNIGVWVHMCRDIQWKSNEIHFCWRCKNLKKTIFLANFERGVLLKWYIYIKMLWPLTKHCLKSFQSAYCFKHSRGQDSL